MLKALVNIWLFVISITNNGGIHGKASMKKKHGLVQRWKYGAMDWCIGWPAKDANALNKNATQFSAWMRTNAHTSLGDRGRIELTGAHCVLAVILAIWKIEIKILDKHDKVKNKDTWCFIQRSILCKCGYNCSMDSATNRRATPFFFLHS